MGWRGGFGPPPPPHIVAMRNVSLMDEEEKYIYIYNYFLVVAFDLAKNQQ